MSRKRRPGHVPRPWQAMQRAVADPPSPERIAALKEAGASDELIAEVAAGEFWRNDLYTVQVGRHSEGWIQELSIRRNDRKPVHDWRHFQRIKSEIAGPDVEAFELYPAEERLMDTANQYYLWCLPPGQRLPVGFETGRNVQDAAEAELVGAVQRPLPEDWKEQ